MSACVHLKKVSHADHCDNRSHLCKVFSLLKYDLTTRRVWQVQPGQSSARSDSSQLQQSPFGGVPADEEEGWWNHDGRRNANLVSSSAEQDGYKVMSDEEVEEAEASDAFPALGYPRNLASVGVGSLCSGVHCYHM